MHAFHRHFVILFTLSVIGCSDTRPTTPGRDVDASVDPGPPGEACPVSTESRVRFDAARVRFGESCVSEVQTRECVDGRPGNFSGTFREPTCEVAPAAACEGEGHGTVQARVRFARAEVASSEGCQSEVQTRACDDGSWSDWSGTFRDVACQERAPEPCEGVAVGTSQSRIRYAMNRVEPERACEPELQTRRCTDGGFTAWSGSFSEETCEARGYASCGATPHGGMEQRTRFADSSVAFGESCRAETQTRRCNDGTFGAWSGSLMQTACSPAQPLACDETAHGGTQQRTRFSRGSVPFGENCEAEAQQRRCDNGSWTPWTGALAAEDCKIEGPVACDATPHGGVQQRTQYAAVSVLYGERCQSELQTRSCSNGTFSEWSGTLNEASCRELPPAPCEGSPHGSEQSRERFEQAHPQDGTACASQLQTRACDNGAWGDWSGTYEAVTCVRCEDRDGDGYGPHCYRGEDCNDGDSTVHPGAEDRELDSTDRDCDGKVGSHLAVVQSLSKAESSGLRFVDEGRFIVVTPDEILAYDLQNMQTPIYRGKAPEGTVTDIRRGVMLVQVDRDATRWRLYRAPWLAPNRAFVPSDELRLLQHTQLYLHPEATRIYGLTSWDGPIRVWTLADGESATEVGQFDVPCTLYGLYFADDLLYGFCQNFSDEKFVNLQIFDPSNLEDVRSIQFSYRRYIDSFYGIAHGHLYAVLNDLQDQGYLSRTAILRDEDGLRFGDKEVSDSIAPRAWQRVRPLGLQHSFAYLEDKRDNPQQRLCRISAESMTAECHVVLPDMESNNAWPIVSSNDEDVVIGHREFARHVHLPAQGTPTLGQRWTQFSQLMPRAMWNDQLVIETDNGVALLDRRTLRTKSFSPLNENISCVATHDGKAYVFGYNDRELVVLDLDTGSVLQRFSDYIHTVRCGVSVRAGRPELWFISGGSDGARWFVASLGDDGLPARPRVVAEHDEIYGLVHTPNLTYASVQDRDTYTMKLYDPNATAISDALSALSLPRSIYPIGELGGAAWFSDGSSRVFRFEGELSQEWRTGGGSAGCMLGEEVLLSQGASHQLLHLREDTLESVTVAFAPMERSNGWYSCLAADAKTLFMTDARGLHRVELVPQSP